MSPLPQLKPAQIKAFHRALHQWYGAHGRRDLPWRNTRDPYAIWVSEIMLQQTQVKTVLERYYGPFLAKFPTVESLASASQTEVMKAWEGLGYYSRAANLQKAAQLVASRESSAFSLTTHDSRLTTLLALPGIGRNTAHAVLAFAFRKPYPVLEANVKRVVARVFAVERPNDAQLWEAAEQLLDRTEPFDYNQAMMDIGAMICTPKRPACALCPANGICKGQVEPERYPAKKVKRQVPTREVRLVIAEDARGRIYLEQRQDRLLGGLYGFPQVSLESSLPVKERLGTTTHTYSHFKLIAEVWVVPARQQQASNHGGFFTRAEIDSLPLSKIDHKALALYDAGRLDKATRKKA